MEAPWFEGEIIGVDASPNMLARGRRNLAATPGRLRVDLVECWAESLAWPDGVFDLVTCLEAFHNFADPRRALAEMCRVLKPGGTLLIDKVGDRHARLIPMKALTAKAFARELTRLGMERIEVRKYERRLGTVELIVAVKSAPG